MKGMQRKKQNKITDELGIPPSTLRTVLKNRHDIEQSGLISSKRQKVKHGKYEELEKVSTSSQFKLSNEWRCCHRKGYGYSGTYQHYRI